ncbi:Nuclear distribution protein PAC1-1 [Grifola frondosa]|uniref:Nuclear distribution protein PAC1 n=1 Tax=Grifola frondosa TaxID=5627 RepID=A0A1C7M6Q5_GRIFR|nr:Nuclear distribution protein PAC1-1 [Grifola frondosa]
MAMMSILTDRQKEELHKSIMEYLHAQNLPQALAALQSELGMDYKPDPKSRYCGILEKKWVSVIRLQKKIMELENRNAALQEELASAPARRTTSQNDWIPRPPARYTLTGHRAPITRVAFHPVFSLLASSSEDTTVKIWDWESGNFERTLKGHTREVWGVDFDSKGDRLVSCSSDLTIKLWDTQQWDNPGYSGKTLHGHEHTVSTVRFLPGDDFIVSASRDKTIRVWEVATTFCIRTITGHDNWVRMVVPSSDGLLLASCSNDNTGRIWDTKSGATKVELRGHEHNVEIVAFAPIISYAAIRELTGTASNSNVPGAYVVTGSRDKLIKLWDAHSGQELKSFAGHNDWIRGLVFHPSGKYLVSASDDKTMRVWELSTGRCIRTIDAHTHFVTCLAWGPPLQQGSDQKSNDRVGEESDRRASVIATGSVDQTIRLWMP